MKKIFLLTVCSVGLLSTTFAQDEKEVMLFSEYNNVSTARSLGIGGAVGSLGADYAGISINPATLGKYSKGEFMFTPSLKLNRTSSNYLSKTSIENKSRLTFDNIGMVLANRKNQKSGWKATNVSFGMNKVANFNREYSYLGDNYKHSITDAFAQEANRNGGLSGILNTSLLTQMAYISCLVDTSVGNPDTVLSYVPVFGGIKQNKFVTERGGINELSFALAGNNNDQLLIGASLGIPIVNYTRTTSYTETDISGDGNNDFKDFNYTETLTTSGAGINLKVGAIYMPISSIRIGASFATPTYYSLTEEGSNTMITHLESFISEIKLPTDNYKSISEYNVTTPYRATLSGSFLFGKYGFISADYEYVDYTSSKISFTNSATDIAYSRNVNNVIKQTTAAANNFRFGGELRNNNYTIRAGYSILGSQTNKIAFDASRRDFSIGAGYRGNSFFADLAWVSSNQNKRDYMYVLNGFPPMAANIASSNKFISMTMGWKF